MTLPECRHRLAVAELQWDNLLLRCTVCPFETVAARCIGIEADATRCPRPVEPEYVTCRDHSRDEPPRRGPA